MLYNWAKDRGASQPQCDRIVGLLTVDWMCNLPLPPRTRRSVGVTDTHWHRFLFRRHVQHILGWTQRLPEGDPAGFSDVVNLLIRTRFYPEANPQRHGETSGGGEDQGSAAEAPTIGEHTSWGQGERSGTGDHSRNAHGLCAGKSPGDDHCHRALGAGDGRIASASKPRRILPAWFARQGETGTRVRPRESSLESRDPDRGFGECADITSAARRRQSDHTTGGN